MTVSPLAPEGANDGAALAPLHSHTATAVVNTRRIAAGSLTAEALPASDTSPLDAAHLYIAAGLAVVPCCALAPGDPPQCTAERAGYSAHKGHGTPDKRGKVAAGKQPLRAWKGITSTALDDARRWWSHAAPHGPNFALLIQGGFLAIDVDGPAGEASLASAVDVLGPLPSTLENVTGRTDGGRHLLFAVPADASALDVEALTKSVAGMHLDGARFVAGGESSGLDLRAGDLDAPRSYIMVAPSVHASGARYQWKPGRVLAELPRRWWDALPRSSSGPKPPTGAALPLDARPGVVAANATERPSARVPRSSSGTLVEVPPSPPGQRQREPRSAAPGKRERAAFEAAWPEICAEVRGAPENRNVTLNSSTLRACRMALAAGVDLDTVCAGMVAAGLGADLTEEETRATVASARTAAEQLGPAPLAERPKRASSRASTGSTSAGAADDVEGAAGEGLPVVDMSTVVADVEDAAIEALARCPDLYQRHPLGLVRCINAPALAPGAPEHTKARAPDAGAPIIEHVPAPLLRSWLSRAATFRAWDGRKEAHKAIAPPEWIAPAVLARKSYPRSIRPLRGVIEAPTLRPDGTVLAAPGYDPATELLLHWQGPAVEVPEHPTRDDARAAFEELAGLFVDFTFQGERGVMLAACVAAVLTPLARAAIRGAVPAFMWEADGPGAGKTLAATVCGALVTGRAPAVRPFTDDDEEMRKVLGAIALASPPVAFFDNVRVHVQGGALEAAITSADTIATRVLGSSSAPELPWRVVLYLTANGVSYSEDNAERFVHIRLAAANPGRVEAGADPGTTERTFAVPELLSHTLDVRPELLRAALTILRAHIIAGRPAAGSVHNRFPEWSRAIGAPIAWASGFDPVRARPPESANRDSAVARALVFAWRAALPSEALTLTALRRRLDAADPRQPGGSTLAHVEALCDLRSALADVMGAPDLARVSSISLGKRLKSCVGKGFPLAPAGTVALTSAPNRDGVQVYRVEVSTFEAPRAVLARGEGAGDAGSSGGFSEEFGGKLPDYQSGTGDGPRVSFDA